MTDDKNLLAGERERHLEATGVGERVEGRVEDMEQRRSLAGEVDRMVLYEERPTLDVVRETTGAVTVRKVIREREETIPVTLKSECLEIVVNEGAGCVRLGDQQLEAGRAYEVELTNERAVVNTETVAVSEVSFEKRVVEQQHRETVTLRREVLDIEDPNQMIANRAELEDGNV